MKSLSSGVGGGRANAELTCCSLHRSSASRQDTAMYPTALTQLARANPFSAPLFTLQKVEEPQQSHHGQRTRRLAAAATADGNPGADLTAVWLKG